jgi:uncharacterized protein YbcI
MRATDALSDMIAEAVRNFCSEQMGIQPKKASVDVHNQSATVTLEGVSHPAEMNLASERFSSEMIEKMYLELFKISKSDLHSRLQHMIGKAVDRSFFAVEPQYGCAVIILFFATALERPHQNLHK